MSEKTVEKIIEKKVIEFISENIELFIESSQSQYWLYINKKGRVESSAALPSYTVPDPANWFPYTDKAIFFILKQHQGLASERDRNYYTEFPDQFCYDSWEYCDEVIAKAHKVFIEMTTERQIKELLRRIKREELQEKLEEARRLKQYE